jgi:hypothetical protein
MKQGLNGIISSGGAGAGLFLDCPSSRMPGAIIPGALSTFMESMGILSAISNNGTLSNSNDADGRAKNIVGTAALNSDCGTTNNNNVICRSGWNWIFKVKFKLVDITDIRLWLAITSDITNQRSHETPGAGGAISYLGLRATTAAVPGTTKFMAMAGDGVSDTMKDFPVPVPIDNLVHKLMIKCTNNGANVEFNLDGQIVNFINTDTLPLNTLDCGLLINLRNINNLAAKNFKFYYAELSYDSL